MAVAITDGGGGLRILGLQGAVPIDGGLPIVMDGKIVGAIGVSGAAGDHRTPSARRLAWIRSNKLAAPP